MTTPKYDQHPLALELMPGGMSAEEFDAFCEDIQQRGIIFPVTLFEGKVLDGWHRYRAALRTNAEVKTMEYRGDDPAGYIAACNIHRRKLSSLQRALFGARVHLRNGVSQAETCRRYSISKTVLAMVLKAIQSRNAAIIKRIETDGDYTRGMLREELEERGLVHANYGRSKAPTQEEEEDDLHFSEPEPPAPVPRVNSIFAMGDAAAAQAEEEDLVGVPPVGKKPTHPERRAKATPAQAMQERWKELMYDEKKTFLEMVWPEARAIAEELALPGLGGASKPRLKVAK